MEGVASLSISGDGSDEIPPVASTAEAHCRVVYDDDATPSMQVTCIHTVASATAAHVHPGAADEVGPPFFFFFDDPASPLMQTFDLTPEQLQMLKDKEFYVNVHSAAFPNGEARANFQGCAASNSSLCLNHDRFQVVVSGVNPNTQEVFAAQARPLSGDSGTFSFFSADNKEMLIKVLNGCAFNGNYWVFFSAATDVAFTVTVTDTQAEMSKSYMNRAGMAAAPVTDTSAFATCP